MHHIQRTLHNKMTRRGVFDEILYHMSYISDMDHVCYISKQKEKRSKEMKRG